MSVYYVKINLAKNVLKIFLIFNQKQFYVFEFYVFLQTAVFAPIGQKSFVGFVRKKKFFIDLRKRIRKIR